ncbi:MAG TPA: hypothetical protein VMW16_00020 [Sedimentisphaerales bacterium]|nr:hypothetical protein [Sedimentisphaerales bacterium]
MAGKNNIQYVQLEPGAFLADIDYQMMTAEERGVYCSIIFYLYANGGKLFLTEQESDTFTVTNHHQIAALSNCFKTGEEWKQIWRAVEKKFKIKKSVLTQKRVTRELARAAKYRRDKSLAGKKGMQQRYNVVTNGDITKRSKVKISKEKVKEESDKEENTPEKRCFSLQQFLDIGFRAGLTGPEAAECYEHYSTQGWKFGNGLEIPSVRDAVVRWRKNRPKFAGDKKSETAEDRLARLQARGEI